MRTYRTLLLAGMLGIGCLPILPSPLVCQRTLVIESFDAELRVESTGDVQVTETIRPRFQGSWNGIYRNLSLDHQTAQGRRERLDVELISITDQAGEPLRYEASNDGRWTRQFQVWIPGAEDATRTLVIRYVVHNAIRFFREGSDVGPPGRALLERHRQRVGGPHRGGERPHRTPGRGGADPVGRLHGRGRVHGIRRFASPPKAAPLPSTPPGPWPRAKASRWPWAGRRAPWPSPAAPSHTHTRAPAVGAPGAAVPGLLPGLSAVATEGKGPEGPRHHRPVRAARERLSPAEVGTLVDHKAEMHDITATLVDLAVRGFVHIQQVEKKTLGIFSHTEYVFHLKKPEERWGGLTTHEERYLTALFKHAGPKAFGGL